MISLLGEEPTPRPALLLVAFSHAFPTPGVCHSVALGDLPSLSGLLSRPPHPDVLHSVALGAAFPEWLSFQRPKAERSLGQGNQAPSSDEDARLVRAFPGGQSTGTVAATKPCQARLPPAATDGRSGSPPHAGVAGRGLARYGWRALGRGGRGKKATQGRQVPRATLRKGGLGRKGTK